MFERFFGTGKTRSVILLGLVLVAVTLSAYWQVADHKFLIYDDSEYIYNNPRMAEGLTGSNIAWAFTTIHASNWHPLTWLSHMADIQFYGVNPGSHHLTNVFFHVASTLLLLLLLFRLTGSPWQSAFVAAMFALHPLHVQSVAWIAERKDVLSAFFCFLTLIIYAEYARRKKPALYYLTIFSFVLGLMAKPMLVTLPAVMLLMDFWPLDRTGFRELPPGRQWLAERLLPLAGLLREKIPFIACSILSAAITIYAQQKGGSIKNFDLIPLGLRIENTFVAYATYLVETFWPHDLAILYPYPSSFPGWQVIGSLLVILLVSWATIRGWRRHPYLAMGWFWFLITLLPVIGLVQVGPQPMADRYTYIPLVGLFIMVAWGVPALAAKLKHREYVLGVLAGTAIAVSAAVTWQQLDYWRDDISIFQHTVQVTSGNFMAHINLGLAYEEKLELDAAMKEYLQALAIAPDHPLAHSNLGSTLEKMGKVDAAIEEYRKAVTLDPRFALGHNNLGSALEKKGETDTAIVEYRKAIAIEPRFGLAQNNLGTALGKKGDLDGAIMEFSKALAIEPKFALAHFNLGTALGMKGDRDGAIREFRQGLAIQPNFALGHLNLGVALARAGDLDGAIQEYRMALAINPNIEKAPSLLAAALDQKRLLSQFGEND